MAKEFSQPFHLNQELYLSRHKVLGTLKDLQQSTSFVLAPWQLKDQQLITHQLQSSHGPTDALQALQKLFAISQGISAFGLQCSLDRHQRPF